MSIDKSCEMIIAIKMLPDGSVIYAKDIESGICLNMGFFIESIVSDLIKFRAQRTTKDYSVIELQKKIEKISWTTG